MTMIKMFSGWRPVVGALTMGALAFAVSVQAAPRDNARGKVKSDLSRLVTDTNDQISRVLDGGVAGVLAQMDVVPGNPGGLTSAPYPACTSSGGVCFSGHDMEAPGGLRVWFDLGISEFAPERLLAMQFKFLGSSLSSGAGDPLTLPVEACATQSDCEDVIGPDTQCPIFIDGAAPNACGEFCCRPGYQDKGRSNWVDNNGELLAWGIPGVNTASLDSDLVYGFSTIGEAAKGDSGDIYYLGTMVFDVPAGALGTYNINWDLSNSSMTRLPDNPVAFQINSGSLIIPTVQCCGGLDCLSDQLSEAGCLALDPNAKTDKSKDCNTNCSCADPDPNVANLNCDDSDACTIDTCVGDNCSFEDIPDFVGGTCCNISNGDICTINDGDDCTDDSCTAAANRGTCQHPISGAGTPCDDGNGCFYNDQCDGANSQADDGCSGEDVNDVVCASNDDCLLPEDSSGSVLVPFDCIGTNCFCTLAPELTFVIDQGGKCTSDGDKISVTVRVGAASSPINGAQMVIEYDPTCLQWNSIAPGGDPYTQEIMQIVDEAAGSIFYAVGIEFGSTGLFGNADLAKLSFTRIGGCADCQLCFGGENPINTYLTDDVGQQIGVTPACSNTLSGQGILSVNVPDSVKSNSDCTSPTCNFSWDPPTSNDSCGGTTMTCEGLHRSGIVLDQAIVMGGGELPQGDSGFTCWVTNDCGEESHAGWTVTCNDANSLDVVLQLSPTMRTAPGDSLTRCIKFEVFANCTQAPLVFEKDIQFGGLFDFVGKFTDTIKIPDAIQPACVTARDQNHTLRSCYIFDPAHDCVDGVLSARFSGDPLLNGNWLIGGNLDGWKKGNPNASHDVIDILDFGQFVAQFNAVYDSNNDQVADGNTPCGVFDSGHADVNGDGITDILDFSFVSMNFLESSKDCCCPASGSTGNTNPRTEVTVRELREMGLTSLISADLNGDGVVNLDDMAAFLNGEVPVKKVRTSGRTLGR